MYCPKDIKVRLQEILDSAGSTNQKAEQIRQLRKGVRSAISLMRSACGILQNDGDMEAYGRMLRSIQGLRDCDDELTETIDSLKSAAALTFGYSPRHIASPSWERKVLVKGTPAKVN